MQAKSTSRKGFSYIELTIVMLVMGILAAIAIPSYVITLANYRANLAARKIVADLHFARSEAQQNSQNRDVQFNTAYNSYTLTNITDIDDSASSYVVYLVDDPFSAVLVSATFGVGTNVTFDRYGRPNSAGTVVVQSGNVQQTVTLASDGTATMP